jgi:hypothetical protein
MPWQAESHNLLATPCGSRVVAVLAAVGVSSP